MERQRGLQRKQAIAANSGRDALKELSEALAPRAARFAPRPGGCIDLAPRIRWLIATAKSVHCSVAWAFVRTLSNAWITQSRIAGAKLAKCPWNCGMAGALDRVAHLCTCPIAVAAALDAAVDEAASALIAADVLGLGLHPPAHADATVVLVYMLTEMYNQCRSLESP